MKNSGRRNGTMKNGGKRNDTMKNGGKVYLVGAGPGDPELLTLKALRALRSADVVLHDELVAPGIVAVARGQAQICSVGKRCGRKSITQEEINALMVGCVRAGLTVVRLKGGDPLVFGRAAEEIEALRRAEIEFEIIPGVTAALAAAAAARIPLTDRRRASAVVLATHHRYSGSSAARKQHAPSSRARRAISPSDSSGAATHSGLSQNHTARAASPPGSLCAEMMPGATRVIYMPGGNYGALAADLRAAGWPAETPLAIISRATTPQQQICRTTLAALPESLPLPSPAVLIVGEVARAAADSEADAETTVVEEARSAAATAVVPGTKADRNCEDVAESPGGNAFVRAGLKSAPAPRARAGD